MKQSDRKKNKTMFMIHNLFQFHVHRLRRLSFRQLCLMQMDLNKKKTKQERNINYMQK